MSAPRKVSDEVLVAAHGRLRSCGLVAQEVGLTRSAVHLRLRAAGVDTSLPGISDEVRAQVRAYYEATPHDAFALDAIAAAVGLSRTSVCNLARGMGLTGGERVRLISAQVARAAGFGNRGRTASPEARAKLSVASRAAWAKAQETQTGHRAPERLRAMGERLALAAAERDPSTNYSRTKKGRRPDLGEPYFRSAWEANYARYLNVLVGRGEIDSWDYEPEVFRFANVTNGVRSYRPDFRVRTSGGDFYYVEVKGWMDAASTLRLQRMAAEYPAIDLRLVDQRGYRAMARAFRPSILTWEGAAS